VVLVQEAHRGEEVVDHHHRRVDIKVALEDTRLVQDPGPHNLSKEAVVDMLVVAKGAVFHNSSNNSSHSTEDLALTINKGGEGEARLHKEGTVVAVAVLAVENPRMVARDHLFPSCTKQPLLHIQPGLP
jgi:hypothetical protein